MSISEVLYPVACAFALALVIWCVTLYTRGLGWWVLLVVVWFGLVLVLSTLGLRYLAGFAEASERPLSKEVRKRQRASHVQREAIVGLAMWLLLLGACICQFGAFVWVAVVFETSETTAGKFSIVPLLGFSSLVIGLITWGLLYTGDLMRHEQVEIKRGGQATVTDAAQVQPMGPERRQASDDVERDS